MSQIVNILIKFKVKGEAKLDLKLNLRKDYVAKWKLTHLQIFNYLKVEMFFDVKHVQGYGFLH